MVNDSLAQGARVAHDWGLASWLGGSMYVAGQEQRRDGDHRP